MARRSIVWVKEEPLGAEFADVNLERGRLAAAGTAVGSAPLGYRATYQLTTGPRYVTTSLSVSVHGNGWWRWLHLERLRTGKWTARTGARGEVQLPAPGGEMSAVDKALDCDLALSPLTNTMPVLRHGLLRGGGPHDFMMAWVSLPDLRVFPSAQRYRFVRRSGRLSVIRYESLSGTFGADLTFDQDGLCVNYPGIGRSV